MCARWAGLVAAEHRLPVFPQFFLQILFQYNARRSPVTIEELVAASAASAAASVGMQP